MADLDKLRSDAETARQYAQHHGVKIWTEHIFAALALADAALARIAKVEALHHKITRYGTDRYSISSESYEDDPSSYEDMEPFDVCAECYAVEKLICEECGGDAPVGHRSNWPCPTSRALTEGENDGCE